MKKITFLLSCFVLFSAFTCENESLDNDIDSSLPNSNNNALLLGEWRALEFSGNSHIESEFMGISLIQDVVFEGANMDYVLIFDGSNFTSEGSYDVVTTLTMDGQTIGPQTQSMTNVTGDGTYSISGNTITFDSALYEFDMVDGMDMASSGPQTATYLICADGQTLTIIQDDQQSINQAGVIATVATEASSVWERVD